jgi:hypothetical protein
LKGVAVAKNQSRLIRFVLADCTAVRDHSCAPAEAEFCGIIFVMLLMII